MSRKVIIQNALRRARLIILLAWLFNCAFSAAAAQSVADQQETTAGTKTQRSQAQAEQEPDTLDELLGLEEEKPDPAAEEAARRQQLEALKRQLEEAPPADSLEMAIEQMDITADLLDQSFDPGLGTQRLQEEILLRFDVLLEKARKGQCSGGSSSGGASRPQTGRDPGRKSGRSGTTPSQGGPPKDSPLTESPLQPSGEEGGELEELQSEWGNLPQRVRDMLMQGRRERFSSLYERLTREYYRRLAEEGS
ncbi:MAG: hypothetical protein JSV91_00965 [Phycisphaerales bacterium]|nr:MAG: hypothetical protein JSV91_00965 [Phycisphaerales bacterium]